jgi:hypothetical protein
MKQPFYTLEILSSRKNSSQKLTPLSLGNNVLGAAASNIDGSLGDINVFLQLS